MDPFEMVVLIVLIATIGGIIKHRINAKHRFKDIEDEMDSFSAWTDDGSGSAERAKLQQRVEQLEERVRTLERIVTDKSARLRDEIDAL